MRRVLLSLGAEVIHLGHDRGAAEVVQAAIEEDADAIAVSSYQGGHVEYFSWMTQLLREAGREDIQVFGGGGGTITDKEIAHLHAQGVARIYSVEDGRRLGLVGMIQDMIDRCAASKRKDFDPEDGLPNADDKRGEELQRWREAMREKLTREVPVLGMTGTGGAGKSSLTDELVRRFGRRFADRRVAVLSVDPSRRRTGGALLGDRIRMNSVGTPHTYMRSMATRQAHMALSAAVQDALLALKAADFDLIILETAGIGQSSSEVVECASISLYVMTPEFGAPTQLEKIDMLDYADLVAINKADKYGSDDALRHVRKQLQRNRGDFSKPVDQQPVFCCQASRFGDQGVNALFDALTDALDQKDAGGWPRNEDVEQSPTLQMGLGDDRSHYLSEIVRSVRDYKKSVRAESEDAWQLDGLARTLETFGTPVPENLQPVSADT